VAALLRPCLTLVKDAPELFLILNVIIDMGSRRDRNASDKEAGGARALLEPVLGRHGLRRSRTREAIVETFLATSGHMSVDELAALVRAHDAGIGHATVYRTLRLLAECGLAETHDFGDGITRYESRQKKAHHDHLLCTSCGEIVEFENSEIEALQEAVARSHGFTTETHKLELYGRCLRCRETQGKGEK